MRQQTRVDGRHAFTPTAIAGLVIVLTLVVGACAATGMSQTQPGAVEATAQAGQSTTQPNDGRTTEPSASDVIRTPGPSVPRVPALQPPAFASRVVVADYDIDLPVVSGDLQPPPNYPFCDVAAYVTRFSQPYESGVTYISAHAQRGMFLPLLAASERNDGAELLGKTVDVYVSDGRLYTYRIARVVRHATDYGVIRELPLDAQHLILQTSEGPYGTLEKLQVVADLETQSTVDVATANPVAMPRDCEPDAPIGSPSAS